MFTIVFCIIVMLFVLGFRIWVLGMGLRPTTYSEPFLKYKIQPAKQTKKYKYILFTYPSEPTRVEALDAVSLLFIHVNVS